MIGGAQIVSIPTECTPFGIVTHEIAHALGAYHEQNRWDRDSYVTLITSNIQSQHSVQYEKETVGRSNDYGVGYDYGSVMHYTAYDFARDDSRPTMITTDPLMLTLIGQKIAPSFADVKRMNLAYCSATCPNTLQCNHNGYPDPNNCNTCKCPPPYAGKLCNRVQLNDCGKNLTATQSLKTISATGAKNCYYLITAPASKKVSFKLLEKRLQNNLGACEYSFIEIKFKQDFTKYGQRFCRDFPTITLSETNQMMVVYQGYNADSFFTMEYRST